LPGPLPQGAAALVLALVLSACGGADLDHPDGDALAAGVRVPLLRAAALSWHLPPRAEALAGMRLVADAPRPAEAPDAVTRSIVRSNPRLSPSDALFLAAHAREAAGRAGLDYGFFAATLLQESAFSPDALSAAGAVGIAQFTLDTADSYGVDPFDWQDAMAGSARLLASYVRQYDGRYPDPYAVALAAYNAGPGAVEQYGGVPPYAETRDYIEDVYDRWGRIVRDTLDPARDGPEPPPGRRRRGS
jgi:soluble lytic murein transglycosylase-like protein